MARLTSDRFLKFAFVLDLRAIFTACSLTNQYRVWQQFTSARHVLFIYICFLWVEYSCSHHDPSVNDVTFSDESEKSSR